jgi:hypothetical protein
LASTHPFDTISQNLIRTHKKTPKEKASRTSTWSQGHLTNLQEGCTSFFKPRETTKKTAASQTKNP